MFRNKFQSGLIPILSGSGLDPLAIWAKRGPGCFMRVTDEDAQVLVIEIRAIQFYTTYIALPQRRTDAIGIRLPCLTMIVKYLKLPFCFEFEVLDSTGMKRRFRCSNAQSKTSINPLLCHLPLALNEGWNQVQLDLPSFTRQAYRTDFVEFLAMQIYANCRVRHVFFSDRWYQDDELPVNYRMLRPTKRTKSRMQRD